MVEGYIGRRPSLLLLLTASIVTLIGSQLVFGANEIIIREVDKYVIIYHLHDILAFLSAPMKSILLWYSLALYPTAMREAAFTLSVGFGVLAQAWLNIFSNAAFLSTVWGYNEKKWISGKIFIHGHRPAP